MTSPEAHAITIITKRNFQSGAAPLVADEGEEKILEEIEDTRDDDDFIEDDLFFWYPGPTYKFNTPNWSFFKALSSGIFRSDGHLLCAEKHAVYGIAYNLQVYAVQCFVLCALPIHCKGIAK